MCAFQPCGYMCVHVCTCVWLHVCTCVWLHVCVCVCVCVWLHAVSFFNQLEAAEAKRFGTRIGKVPVQLFWHKPKGPMEGGGRGRGRGRDHHGHGDVASISSSSSVMGVPWGRGFQPYTPSGSTVSGSDLDVLGRQEVNFEKQKQEVNFEKHEQEVVGIRDPRKRSAPSVFDRLGSVVHSTPPAQEGEEWRENTLEDPGMEDVEYAATTSRKKTKVDCGVCV